LKPNKAILILPLSRNQKILPKILDNSTPDSPKLTGPVVLLPKREIYWNRKTVPKPRLGISLYLTDEVEQR
jgi:hypothetical protein